MNKKVNSQKTDNETRVYTVSEIMGILSISKTTAYSFVKNNPPFKVLKVNETYRILKESFDEWLNKGFIAT